MVEGVVDEGQVVAGGVATGGAPPEPPPDPLVAPHGWVKDRKTHEWRPRKRAGRKASPAARLAAAADRPVDQLDGQVDDAGGWVAERDPEPARLVDDDDAKPALERRRPEPPPKDVVDDIAAMGGLVGMMLLPWAVRVDPHCGGALADSWDRIIGASVPLICRSESVVHWVTGASGLRLWIGLGIALQPVGKAIVQHHITRSVRIDRDEDGQAQVVAEDWSGYTAAA